jgi:4-amino-4-deoxy-L-arabinose transferase-like glycosyltransferase
MIIKIIATLIIVTSVMLAVTSFWNDVFTVDEVPHVGAGYSYFIKSDYRLNPEHPPLAKDFAGFALSFIDLKQDAFDTPYWQENINGQWEFGRKLIYNSGNDAQLMTRVAKIPMLLFFIGAAVLVFTWTRKLYGDYAGLTSIFLFSFSPTILAHARLVHTDMPALFGIIAATYFFVNFLKDSNKKNLWVAGLIFGIAQLTKFSVVLLIPYFLILAIVFGLIQSLTTRYLIRTTLIILIGYIFVVLPWYIIHTRTYPPDKQKTDTVFHLKSYPKRDLVNAVTWASDKPILRAGAQYATGLILADQRARGGNLTYFYGEITNESFKSYFPIVYIIKEPLAFWALVLIVFSFAFRNVYTRAYTWIKDPAPEGRASPNIIGRHFAEFSMVVWLVLYWIISIFSNINIGIRHLLPVYGFTYILLSGQLTRIINYDLRFMNKKITTMLIIILFGWYGFVNIKAHPSYLSYFNEYIGSSKGYKYVVDSNVDWGQDLKRLGNWLEDNNIETIHLDYWGWADQRYYLGNGFNWVISGRYRSINDFIEQNPNGGYLAVSKHYYMSHRNDPVKTYAWLDTIKPIADIGGSIFVWQLRP